MITIHEAKLTIELARLGWFVLAAFCGFTAMYMAFFVAKALWEKAIPFREIPSVAATFILIGCTGWFSYVVLTSKVF